MDGNRTISIQMCETQKGTYTIQVKASTTRKCVRYGAKTSGETRSNKLPDALFGVGVCIKEKLFPKLDEMMARDQVKKEDGKEA